MIQVESTNGTEHVAADRQTGRPAARRRLLDVEAVDLSRTRPHARDERRPPSDCRNRDRPAARALGGDRRESALAGAHRDRKSTRLNSSHLVISYAVFCLKKKKKDTDRTIH